MAAARQNEKPGDSIPGPFGAHNWHSMSFNPQTGLVYLPAQNIPLSLCARPSRRRAMPSARSPE
ncbi:hypothetical protein LJR084_007309 [Variovorax sp. LjRoot84]|uniref:hypothetical protein n=1 Tax=Variovorax sp. LjRoot84 TaxID=3342340 RepID=UPI003ECEAFA0